MWPCAWPFCERASGPAYARVIHWHYCINWHTALFWRYHCFTAGIFTQPSDSRYIFSACHVFWHSADDQRAGYGNGVFQGDCRKIAGHTAASYWLTCRYNRYCGDTGRMHHFCFWGIAFLCRSVCPRPSVQIAGIITGSFGQKITRLM